MSLIQVLIFCFVVSVLGVTFAFLRLGGVNLLHLPNLNSPVRWSLRRQIGFFLGLLLFVVAFLYTMYKRFDYNLITGLVTLSLTEIVSFISIFQPIFALRKKEIPLWLNLLIMYIAIAIGHIVGYLTLNGDILSNLRF